MSVVLASLLPVAAAAEPIRRSHVIELSDDALARRLFGDMGRDLIPGYRDRERLRLGRRSYVLRYWTRPRRAATAGICESEELTILLRAESLPPQTPDPALHLTSIETRDWFFVADEDLARRDASLSPDQANRLDAACAALDPTRAERRAPAESSFQLMRAYALTAQLGDAARAGRAPAGLDCGRINSNRSPPTEAECLASLSVLRDRSVVAAQSCGEYGILAGGCLRAQTDDWFIYYLLDTASRPTRILVQGMEDLSQAHWVYD